MKRILLATVIFFCMLSLKSQGFIGLHEQNIMQVMDGEHPGLVLQSDIRNSSVRYLKYLSKDNQETWVIFLDDSGICKGVRITCANSRYDSRIRELNELYQPGDLNRWSYTEKSEKIDVSLKREDYFFTVTWERSKKRGKSGNDRAA
ncbi:MAG: hypothetical protein P1P83_03300 [Bacteroidales bacterium]|nr:hypothetical protein [Bacteroidales bacterium]MDT8372923.1 hypothetical protein [Bacteroidales bacterium]